jgi:hypothetical protein
MMHLYRESILKIVFKTKKGMLLVVDTSTCMAVVSRSTSSDDETLDEILAGKRKSLNGG